MFSDVSVGKIQPVRNKVTCWGFSQITQVQLDIVLGSQALADALFKRFDKPTVAGAQLLSQIGTALVDRAARKTPLAHGVDLELGKVRRSDFFVGVHLHVGRMVDRDQLDLVEVARLPQFLGELNPVRSFVGSQTISGNPQVFPSTGRSDTAFGRLQSQRRRPQAIREEAELPVGQRVDVRARTLERHALADRHVAPQLHEVLRYAVGPHDADLFGQFPIAQTEMDRRGIDHLRLVPATGTQFDQAADRVVIAASFVVLLAHRIERQPVVVACHPG